MVRPSIWKPREAVQSALFSDPVELSYWVDYFRAVLKECSDPRSQQVLKSKIVQFRKVLQVFEPIDIKPKRGKKAA